MRADAHPPLDVLLITEGSYPCVKGGVTSWTQQIITGMPALKFGVVAILADPSVSHKPVVAIPDNLVFQDWLYLFGKRKQRALPAPRKTITAGDFDRLMALCESELMAKDTLQQFLAALVGAGHITYEQFERHPVAWQVICSIYDDAFSEIAFTDFFWHVRNMMGPIFRLADVVDTLPKANIIHSVAAGYGGMLGALLRTRQPDSRYMLTEHGLYTKERVIDLLVSAWLKTPVNVLVQGLEVELSPFRELWINYFRQLGNAAYQQADAIYSLFKNNRQRQIRDGADAAITRVIPNGIDLSVFADPYQSATSPPQRIALVGRVVPIKDIKTYILAAAQLSQVLPGTPCWIVGPEDEDEDYTRQCQDLVQALQLEQVVHFKGFMDLATLLPQLGLLVLTSVSEGQPIVVLEAFAAGVPCVCTDVGCCRELIFGHTDEDAALGAAGDIVMLADPVGTAQACVNLLTDTDRWRQCQHTALQRVQRYYSETLMIQRYQSAYQAIRQEAD